MFWDRCSGAPGVFGCGCGWWRDACLPGMMRRMGELLDLRGVATWHEVSGSGAPVVLLHGGLTNGECFALQVPAGSGRVEGARP